MLLDCLGTLVRLDDPVGRLAALTGMPAQDAALAMRAEIAFYRANLMRARDAASLAQVRAECAQVAGVELDTLLAAIAFEPFEDVVPTLTALRERGVALAVVSNWDVSLHEVLDRTGLRPLVDVAVSSAEVGVAKPDPEPFHVALRALAVAPADAWYVGDSPEEDVEGARAAGVRPLLLDRARGDTLASLLAG